MRLDKNPKSGILFVAVTIIWTWGILAVPVAGGLDFNNTVTRVAYLLAGGSPSVIGLIFVLLSGDKSYLHSFLKRLVTVGNARAKWLLIAFTLVPAITLLSVIASFLLTSAYQDFSILFNYVSNFAELILFAAFTFIFGPLAEEIGWRGYLLDCWSNKGILVYGAGIGLVWTIWHLPMFFIAGTYQNMLLLQGVIPVICFVISTTALGVIIGHLSKTTNSILLAVLFHFTVNFTGELIPLELTAKIIHTAIIAAIASGIIYRSQRKRRIGGADKS